MPRENPVTVRIGLPKATGSLPIFVEELGAPALVSAASLWDNERKRFREVPPNVWDVDVALDSAGFVAMSKHGGYRWSVDQYVALAGSYGWSWWSQMDLCCEPEIASDPEQVRLRVFGSSFLLSQTLAVVRRHRAAGATYLTDPMPVLQGWTADDYELCVSLYDEVLGGKWPSLVGVGSVCRRHMHGPAGLSAILERLDRVLPKHVRLHLFGVKGTALERLASHPRVASIDSAAWGTRARQEALEEGVSCTIDLKEAVMGEWYAKNRARADAADAPESHGLAADELDVYRILLEHREPAAGDRPRLAELARRLLADVRAELAPVIGVVPFTGAALTPTMRALADRDVVAYAKARILGMLPLYGAMTESAMGETHGDPRRPGSTLPPDVVARAVRELVNEGRLERAAGGRSYVLAPFRPAVDWRQSERLRAGVKVAVMDALWREGVGLPDGYDEHDYKRLTDRIARYLVREWTGDTSVPGLAYGPKTPMVTRLAALARRDGRERLAQWLSVNHERLRGVAA